MTFDASDLNALASVLGASAGKLAPDVKKVVSKGSLNIKKQIQKDFRASPHFKGVRDISYNLTDTANGIEGEVGPYVDSEGFGSLVGVAIHGGSRGGGGTVPDPLVALQAEEPNFIEALTDLAGAVLDE